MFQIKSSYANLSFFCVTELEDEFGLSRPTIHKYLDNIKNLLNKTTWKLHTRVTQTPNRHEKRPTLYVDEYIVNALRKKIALQNYFEELYALLPSDRQELKRQLLQFILKDDQHRIAMGGDDNDIENFLTKKDLLDDLNLLNQLPQDKLSIEYPEI